MIRQHFADKLFDAFEEYSNNCNKEEINIEDIMLMLISQARERHYRYEMNKLDDYTEFYLMVNAFLDFLEEKRFFGNLEC